MSLNSSFFQCLGLFCLLVGNCRSHTVKICALEEGSDVTWYAGTYHGQSEINTYGATTGSIILTASDGTVSSHAFTSLTADVSELPPDCVSGSCECHTCSSYTSNGIANWQQVTVSGLTSGSYTATASTTTVVEWPWCTNLPAFTIDLETEAPTTQPTEPTPEPTLNPTQAPTWVAPCETDPCDCTEDAYCIQSTCHSDGCGQCVYNYFKLDQNYHCANCQDVFGVECLHCQNYNGCAQCADGYIRTYDHQEDVFYCEPEPPTPAPVGVPTASPVPAPPSTCTDNISECASTNCADAGENAFCTNQQSWGCPSCQSGYFQKSHQYPCTQCSHLNGCIACADFQGCTQCDTGYTWYWDSYCNIGMCL